MCGNLMVQLAQVFLYGETVFFFFSFFALIICIRKTSENMASMANSFHFQTSEDLYQWLSSWPTVKSQCKLIVEGLRRRQLQGAHPCAKATIELLRNMLGTCKFHSTYHLMNAIRAIGRELQAVAPSELTIGNIASRVLFIVREEYHGTNGNESQGTSINAVKPATSITSLSVSLSTTPSTSTSSLVRSSSSAGLLSTAGMTVPSSPSSADLLTRRLSSSPFPGT